MKSPGGKVFEPPPQNENVDNDEENEKSVQKTTNTLTNLNLNPELSQNNTPTQQKKVESKNRKTTPATLKTPVQPKDDTTGADIIKKNNRGRKRSCNQQ